MSYVPMPIYVPDTPISPEVRDLSHEIESTIEKFRGRSPTLSDTDIRAALSVVEKRHQQLGGGVQRIGLAVVLALGAILFAVLILVARG